MLNKKAYTILLFSLVIVALASGIAFGGQPMVRVGDMTAHGSPLSPGPGSPTVLVCGDPAWRATIDLHVCPLVDPLQRPHGSGVVPFGSNTVLVNGYPAVYQGCFVQEIPFGGPNTITLGCPTVLCGP